MTRKQQVLLALALLLAAYWLAPVVWSWFASEEAKIRALLEQVREGCAEQDIPKVMDVLAEGFRDSEGHTAKDVHRVLLFLFFQQKRPLYFQYREVSVQLAPNGKAAKVFLIAQETDSLGRAKGRTVEVRLTLQKREGQWKIWSAQYETNSPWSSF